jgi:hypothetical protein
LWTGFCFEFTLASVFSTLSCSEELAHNRFAYLQSFKELISAVLRQFLQIRVYGGLVNHSLSSLVAIVFLSFYSN